MGSADPTSSSDLQECLASPTPLVLGPPQLCWGPPWARSLRRRRAGLGMGRDSAVAPEVLLLPSCPPGRTRGQGGALGAEGGRGVCPSLAPTEASPAERALAAPDGAWGAGPGITAVGRTQGGCAALCPAPTAWAGMQVTPGPPGCPPPPSGEGVPGLGGLKAEQRVCAPTLTLTLSLPACGPSWSQRKLMTPTRPPKGALGRSLGEGPGRQCPGGSLGLQSGSRDVGKLGQNQIEAKTNSISPERKRPEIPPLKIHSFSLTLCPF